MSLTNVATIRQHETARAMAAETAAAAAAAREATKDSETIQAKADVRRLQDLQCRTEKEVARLRSLLEVRTEIVASNE